MTKGHPFERDPFFAMLEATRDIAFTQVEHPAAQRFFSPETAAAWDATLLYDMPGIEFGSEGARFHDPPADYVADFEQLIEAGHGFVFLHHALAGWPTWPRYGEWTGGRFLYAPAEVRGVSYPDSGYRHGVSHRVTPSSGAAGHPVLEGLEGGYEIVDELYLCPLFADLVTPLLASDATYEAGAFYSAANALRGKMFSSKGWTHPAGVPLAAWTQVVGRSPIVTIAGGDGPDAYANPGLRRLIGNALHFVAREAERLRAA